MTRDTRDTLENEQLDPLATPSPDADSAQRASSLADQETTYKFKRPPYVALTPHWGAVSEGYPKQLKFEFADDNAPLTIEFAGELVMGRGEYAAVAPDLDLASYGAYKHGVSRHHAVIRYVEDTLKLMDLGSTNGTFLNGSRLPPHQARILRDGDELALGTLVMYFRTS